MAVEEIVKENTPKAEGEAQGVKYISLTEEELERLIKAAGREGAKKGVEAYERRKEKDKEELADKVKNSAKTIIIHYRQLKRMKNTSVTGTDTVTDPTLKEILDGILEQVRKEEFNLTSTNKNRIVTGMLLNHVDVQLENYKKECKKSKMAAGVAGQPMFDSLSFSINTQDPGIASWIKDRGAEFVTSCTAEQKKAIRSLLAKKITDQHTVDELARFIRP